MSFTKADFAQATRLDENAVADYAHWGEKLQKWNPRINLVAPSTLDDYWHRHAYDSWQVTPHVSEAVENIIDLGSGAGFPAIALAIEMKQRGRGHVTLVESAGKKVNFLRSVVRDLNLPATVLNVRVESLKDQTFDLVTARAFAPLPRLLSYAHPFWSTQTRGLFLKGQGLAQELLAAQKDWAFTHQPHKSLTDDMASLVEIAQLAPLNA